MSEFVDFLRTYGPVSASDSLCVENLLQTQKEFGVRPIETKPPRAADIVNALAGDHPRNVIVTGTAGDGKTYHIRDFLGQMFPDAVGDWPGEADILRFTLPSGTELRVIRDLSEISDSNKAAELSTFSAALKGESPIRYLVAANDGQLLKYFRDAGEGSTGEAARSRELHRVVSEMLRNDAQSDPSMELELINLSRTWNETVVDSIFDAVLEHVGWDDGCLGCPGAAGEKPCPILLNRELLRNIPGKPSPFRSRLKQAMSLAAANDQHVPIRQLLMLAVNILLGDARSPNKPLLDCKTAQARAKQDRYADTNPYDNALGLNLRPERRATNRVFSVLEMFAIGHETNNLLDAVLVHGRPPEMHKTLFEDEHHYGLSLFQPQRDEYFALAGANGDGSGAKRFRTALASQRRRAFFRLPADPGQEMASPWRLTIFHHGGAYLSLADSLASGGRREQADRATRQLVKGMNRAFTGMMTSDEDRLWLSGTIGKTDEPSGRVATVDALERGNANVVHLKLTLNATTGRPALSVYGPRILGSKDLGALDLRPLLFEYLIRVSNGSLPATFSRQCNQELKHFALRTQTEIKRLFDEDGGYQMVQVLTLGAKGELSGNRLEVGG